MIVVAAEAGRIGVDMQPDAAEAEAVAERALKADGVILVDGPLSPGVRAALDNLHSYREPAHVSREHQKEMDKLSTIRLCARSQGLATAVRDAMAVKEGVYRTGRKLGQAEEFVGDLPDDTPEAILEEARAVAATADRAFQVALRELDDAADAVAHAPVGGLGDVLDRAVAVAYVTGEVDNAGLPVGAERAQAVLLTYRNAIEDMYERARVDEDDTFPEGLMRLQKVEGRLTYLNRLWDEKWGNAADVPKNADPELRSQINDAYAERDKARNLMYAGTPKDVGELLELMVIAFDHIGGGGVDVSTYEVRDRVIGDEPVEERDMWENGRGAHRRALALIARHAARLRDQSMPKDWRDLMETMSRIANGRDAVWRAYDKGMDAGSLKNVQLAGMPDDELPVLLFEQPDGTYWIRPDASFKGEVMQ